MKAVIGRGIILSFLFIAIAAVYIYFLLGLPLEESWFAFYELQFADVPLGWWVLNTIFLLAWGIAIWTGFLGSSKEKAIEQRITGLIDTEKEIDSNEKFSPRMDRAIGTVSTVIQTQRKSLQRIIDERAEAQDQTYPRTNYSRTTAACTRTA